MKNFLTRTLHQSFFLIAFAIGVIAGTILGLVFHINFFASPIWLILVILLFIFTYFQPKYVFLSLALIAGLLLAFFRVASALEIQAQQKAQQTEKTVTTDTRESWLLTTRDWLTSRIHSALAPAENEASLGVSYLLGQKSDLDKTTSENLRTIGLVHIVVASGTHLSILVTALAKIFHKSRRVHLLFSTLFVIIFMALIGFTPSILRAGLMTILALVAGYSGRRIAPWRLILLVAAATLIIDPTFVIDLGWLLSFASYTGIMILGPALAHFFHGDKTPPKLSSAILTSLSATLLTLPITLYYFGQFSLLSIFANLLILPTLPLALGLTFATGLLASPIISTLTQKLLTLHIWLINLLASQPSFLITIEKYQPAVFLLYIPLTLPFIIGLFRRKVLKSRKDKGRKICQDIANGKPPNAKKPSLTRNAAPSSRK